MPDQPNQRDKRFSHGIDPPPRSWNDSYRWRTAFILGCTMIPVGFGLLYLDVPTWLIFLSLIGVVVFDWLALVAWHLVIHRGIFTWLALACRPALAVARGDSAEAERAFQLALERAQRFPATDLRRGLMLVQLSQFVKNQGRYREAKALLEECVVILAGHQHTNPMDYFIALNFHAVYFVHLRDYVTAQSILEKILDLTVVVSKGIEDWTGFQHNQISEIRFLLRLNLVYLFIEIRELAEARHQLGEADSILPNLRKGTQAKWHDYYIAIRTLLMFASGDFADAGKELERSKNPDYPTCMRARAKLLLVREDFNQAEQVLDKYLKQERMKGLLDRPEFLDPKLDLAEALFGQSKRDDAFASLQEARAIVADFALPADAAWRKSLETWSPRARELGKADVAASLDAELGAMPAGIDQRITILERFRVREKDEG